MNPPILLATALPMLLIGILWGSVLGSSGDQAAKVALLTGTSRVPPEDAAEWAKKSTENRTEAKQLEDTIKALAERQIEAYALETSLQEIQDTLPKFVEELRTLETSTEDAYALSDWESKVNAYITDLETISSFDSNLGREMNDVKNGMNESFQTLRKSVDDPEPLHIRRSALENMTSSIKTAEEFKNRATETLRDQIAEVQAKIKTLEAEQAP